MQRTPLMYNMNFLCCARVVTLAWLLCTRRIYMDPTAAQTTTRAQTPAPSRFINLKGLIPAAYYTRCHRNTFPSRRVGWSICAPEAQNLHYYIWYILSQFLEPPLNRHRDRESSTKRPYTTMTTTTTLLGEDVQIEINYTLALYQLGAAVLFRRNIAREPSTTAISSWARKSTLS